MNSSSSPVVLLKIHWVFTTDNCFIFFVSLCLPGLSTFCLTRGHFPLNLESLIFITGLSNSCMSILVWLMPRAPNSDVILDCASNSKWLYCWEWGSKRRVDWVISCSASRFCMTPHGQYGMFSLPLAPRDGQDRGICSGEGLTWRTGGCTEQQEGAPDGNWWLRFSETCKPTQPHVPCFIMLHCLHWHNRHTSKLLTLSDFVERPVITHLPFVQEQIIAC